MTYLIAAYFDTDLEKFYPPFLVPGMVEDLVENINDAGKKGKIEEFDKKKAFLLGTFETETAKIECLEKPQLLVDLTLFRKDV